MSVESKKTLKVATDLLWGIVHGETIQKPHKVGDVVDMLSVMYPGINYWHARVGLSLIHISEPTRPY